MNRYEAGWPSKLYAEEKKMMRRGGTTASTVVFQKCSNRFSAARQNCVEGL
jgi:hypothetical protein